MSSPLKYFNYCITFYLNSWKLIKRKSVCFNPRRTRVWRHEDVWSVWKHTGRWRLWQDDNKVKVYFPQRWVPVFIFGLNFPILKQHSFSFLSFESVYLYKKCSNVDEYLVTMIAAKSFIMKLIRWFVFHLSWSETKKSRKGTTIQKRRKQLLIEINNTVLFNFTVLHLVLLNIVFKAHGHKAFIRV